MKSYLSDVEPHVRLGGRRVSTAWCVGFDSLCCCFRPRHHPRQSHKDSRNMYFATTPLEATRCQKDRVARTSMCGYVTAGMLGTQADFDVISTPPLEQMGWSCCLVFRFAVPGSTNIHDARSDRCAVNLLWPSAFGYLRVYRSARSPCKFCASRLELDAL